MIKIVVMMVVMAVVIMVVIVVVIVVVMVLEVGRGGDCGSSEKEGPTTLHHMAPHIPHLTPHITPQNHTHLHSSE